MADVNRKPDDQSVHNVHTHACPKCERTYTCNCAKQPDKEALICRDCEAKGA